MEMPTCLLPRTTAGEGELSTPPKDNTVPPDGYGKRWDPVMPTVTLWKVPLRSLASLPSPRLGGLCGLYEGAMVDE